MHVRSSRPQPTPIVVTPDRPDLRASVEGHRGIRNRTERRISRAAVTSDRDAALELFRGATDLADSALENYRLQGSCAAPISATTVRSPSLLGRCGWLREAVGCPARSRRRFHRPLLPAEARRWPALTVFEVAPGPTPSAMYGSGFR